MRKLNLLRTALLDHSGAPALTRAVVSKAFKHLCHVGGGDASRQEISYTRLLKALRTMAKSHKAYEDLTFRYHVVARPIGQLDVGPSKALASAEATDFEEMLYFIRSLDEEDHGRVSEDSFVNVMAVRTRTSSMASRTTATVTATGHVAPAAAN